MRSSFAAALAALSIGGCSMVPYYSEVKAVADAGIATAVQDRKEFNDKKLAVNLVALCDSSIGAVNRYPDASVRDFIGRLCGGDGEAISMDRLAELVRALDQLKSSGS
jgi:hypothetical protein